MIYYSILFLIFFGSILSVFIKDKIDKLIVFSFLFFFLIIFAGFRFETGFDYDNYYLAYKLVNDAGFSWDIEPLIAMLMKFCEQFSLDYGGFIFIMAFLAISLKAKFIWKYSVIPLLSAALYFSRIFLIADFGQIRQGLALALVLWSYVHIVDKNFKKYLLILFIALFVHVSSILFFPIYFIAHKKIKPLYLLITLTFAILIATLNVKELLVGYMSNYLPEFVARKLLYYGEAESEEIIGITYSVVLRISLMLTFLLFFRKKIYDSVNYLVFFNIYFWGIIFYLIFNSLPQLSGRGSMYFQQFELFLFPYLIYLLRDNVLKIIVFIFIFIYCLWGISSTINSQEGVFLPYKSLLLTQNRQYDTD